jgi:hypothetical protein
MPRSSVCSRSVQQADDHATGLDFDARDGLKKNARRARLQIVVGVCCAVIALGVILMDPEHGRLADVEGRHVTGVVSAFCPCGGDPVVTVTYEQNGVDRDVTFHVHNPGSPHRVGEGATVVFDRDISGRVVLVPFERRISNGRVLLLSVALAFGVIMALFGALRFRLVRQQRRVLVAHDWVRARTAFVKVSGKREYVLSVVDPTGIRRVLEISYLSRAKLWSSMILFSEHFQVAGRDSLVVRSEIMPTILLSARTTTKYFADDSVRVAPREIPEPAVVIKRYAIASIPMFVVFAILAGADLALGGKLVPALLVVVLLVYIASGVRVYRRVVKVHELSAGALTADRSAAAHRELDGVGDGGEAVLVPVELDEPVGDDDTDEPVLGVGEADGAERA